MDDIYQIEDIPLTKNRQRSTKLSKTLAMLEVGQSFLVPEPLTADDLKKIAGERCDETNGLQDGRNEFLHVRGSLAPATHAKFVSRSPITINKLHLNA